VASFSSPFWSKKPGKRRLGVPPHLPIIIHKKDQKTPTTSSEKGEVNIFFDEQRDPESARRLTEIIRGFGKINSLRPNVKRRGLPAPMGD